MRTLVCLLVFMSGALAGPSWQDEMAWRDSLRDVPPKQRAWWLQERGLDASYYTDYRKPDSGGLHMVGKYGRGPSVEVTGQDTLVALTLGSEVALLSFANPDSPRVLSEIQLDFLPSQSAIRDTLLYTCGNGLEIWDITDATRPERLTVIPRAVGDFSLQDTFLYFVSQDTFWVYSVANPASPYSLGCCRDSGHVATSTEGTVVLALPQDALGFVDVSDPSAPQRVGFWPGWVQSAAARGNLCCVTFADAGQPENAWMLALDISNPATPQQLGRLNGACGYDMHLDGDFAVLSGRYEAYEPFQIVSIADSVHPSLAGQLDLNGQRWGVWSDLGRDLALVAADGYGLDVVDVSNPESPQFDTAVVRADLAEDVWLDGTRAFVADYRGGVRIVDVSDPSQPVELGGMDSLGQRSTCEAVAARDSFAFAGWRPYPPLRSIDVTDPAHPEIVAGVWTEAIPMDMVLRDTWLYVVGAQRFHAVNVARPREPVLVGSCNGDGVAVVVQDSFAYTAAGQTRITNVARPDSPYVVATIYGHQASGIAVRDTFLYIPAGYDTVWVYSVASPAAPRLVGYTPMPTHLWDIALADSVAAVATVSGLELISLADPAHPQRLGGVATPRGPRRVVYSAPYFYAAMWDAGVGIYETTQTGMAESRPLPVSPRATLRAWPNPVARWCRLTTAASELVVVAVRDVAGRKVRVPCVRVGTEMTLDFGELPPGVYFVEAASTGRRETAKVAKR